MMQHKNIFNTSGGMQEKCFFLNLGINYIKTSLRHEIRVIIIQQHSSAFPEEKILCHDMQINEHSFSSN